jgi:hypothetical protein
MSKQSTEKEQLVQPVVVLEKLEYCYLQDEDGTIRFVGIPGEVFSKTTEKFLTLER